MSKKIAKMDFIAFWQGASGVAEVADHFGITHANASTRASNYRKQLKMRGKALKEFEKGGGASGEDWDDIAGMIDLPDCD